jgi:gliding motility-associated-like protein
MKFFPFFLFLVFAIDISLQAQLCTGSLGDPVVHIDFGKGSGTGPALKPGITTYSHVSINCPQDGYYTLHNSVSGCHGSTWHTIAEDHTPNDVDGYYMLVNASYTPGDFFVDTIRGLCGNTTYEFAAWVVNVLKPNGVCGAGIDPNLTFSIETKSGTVLAQQFSGSISESASPVWTQYGVFFKTPVNITDVIVRITNNAPGGCGNDLALDDITFRPCGPKVNASILSTGQDTAQLCEGDTSALTITAQYSGGYISPVFQWQESKDKGVTWKDIPGAATMSFLRPAAVGAATYQYKMLIGEASNFSSATCRTASNTVTISVYPLPVVNIAPSIKGCENSHLRISVTGAATSNWNGPNGFTASSTSIDFSPLKMAHAGTYSVIASSDKGCSNKGSTILTIFPFVTASVTPDLTICEGTSRTLSASGGSQYRWLPSKGLSDASSSTPVAQPSDSTLYQVIVSNQFGCADTARVMINVLKKPVANAGPDKRTKKGAPVQLEGLASGTNISYYWTPSLSNSSSLTPIASPSQSTVYTLHVVSGVGCGTSTDNMELRVYEIPNAFSPNGDGTNDVWLIKSAEAFAGASVEVYNRYGQVVFRSVGYSKPWDGNYNNIPVPAGTYYYLIDLKSSTEPNITGWLMIVR